jgi:hypothetical protein
LQSTVDNPVPQPDGCTAVTYANRLLASLGVATRCEESSTEIHPALRYAQSGLLALTGNTDTTKICPLPLATCADGALQALRALASDNPAVINLQKIDGGALLGERAALTGYRRAGAISAGGSCRLLQASDGWLVLNLARDDDWDLLPAWIEMEATRSWDDIAAVLTTHSLATCIERGRLLGLALAPMQRPAASSAWYETEYQHPDTFENKINNRAPNRYQPLVIDLSSLWAGPLCTHLLQQLGARVIKVESIGRPDGARNGVADFYNLLNAGKESVALDFSTSSGRTQLRMLCESADIVIEASRPRALRQLGIDAEAIIVANPALTWVSITGYGRREPAANWVAFGDDAAVAAGLSQLLFDIHGEALFCGDAVADPLTGLHAAVAAWHSYTNGGGRLLALALRDVVAHCVTFDQTCSSQTFPRQRLSPQTFSPQRLRERCNEWRAVIERAQLADCLPSARKPSAVAAALGADTYAVLRELNIPC